MLIVTNTSRRSRKRHRSTSASQPHIFTSQQTVEGAARPTSGFPPHLEIPYDDPPSKLYPGDIYDRRIIPIDGMKRSRL